MNRPLPAGVGLGWRPALAAVPAAFEAHTGGRLAFAEALADPLFGMATLPPALAAWRAQGLPVVPHGVGLALGGAVPPDPRRLDALATLARRLDAPLVSEHLAFVRAGGLEAGHLLPVPRTRAALAVVAENVAIAQARLPVPLAIENGAPLADWPDAELDEAEFLAELVARTGCWLLLDLANLHANAVNFGRDPLALLDRLPLDRVAYVHLAGGALRAGRWEDTHAHPLADGALALLGELVARVGPVPALLERDDAFPGVAETVGELAAIAAHLPSPLRGEVGPSGPGEGNRPAPGVPRSPHPGCAGPLPGGEREALAVQQEALLRALLTHAPPPPGFDPAALAAASDQLLRKRRRLVARAFPALTAWLGDGFAPAFAAHARAHPSAPARPIADGLRFARGQRLDGAPPAVRRELALAVAGRWPAPLRRLARGLARWRYRDGGG